MKHFSECTDEDADEEVEVKIEPTEDVGVHETLSSALNDAGPLGYPLRHSYRPPLPLSLISVPLSVTPRRSFHNNDEYRAG